MWTSPRDWSNERVTASLMNLVRDNLAFLYTPPQCRVAVKGGAGGLLPGGWAILDWPKTLTDNDMMRALSGSGQNEPETGLVEVQTAGKYLAHTVIDFDGWTSGAQVVAVSVRANYSSGFASPGRVQGGLAVADGPNTIVPVVGAWPCSAGFQWAVQVYITAEEAGKIVPEWGAVPYFYVHWIGGP